MGSSGSAARAGGTIARSAPQLRPEAAENSYNFWTFLRADCSPVLLERSDLKSVPDGVHFNELERTQVKRFADRPVGQYLEAIMTETEASLGNEARELDPAKAATGSEAFGKGVRSSALQAPDSRDKILEVAEGLFAHGGYAGVGMRQLASTVGLSKSSLFHHFSSKQDLYADVLDRVLERIEQGLDAYPETSPGATARLEAWVDAVICTLSEDMPAGRLMMRALVDEEPFPAVLLDGEGEPERALMPFEIRLTAIIDRFGTLLTEGIQSGEFRPVAIGDTILSVMGILVFHFRVRGTLVKP